MRIVWGGEVYQLPYRRGPTGNTTFRLSKIRDIVCKSESAGNTQLDCEKLIRNTLVTKGTGFGKNKDPVFVTLKEAVSVMNMHACGAAGDNQEDVLALFAQLALKDGEHRKNIKQKHAAGEWYYMWP
jgi:hypothetical protein